MYSLKLRVRMFVVFPLELRCVLDTSGLAHVCVCVCVCTETRWKALGNPSEIG